MVIINNFFKKVIDKLNFYHTNFFHYFFFLKKISKKNLFLLLIVSFINLFWNVFLLFWFVYMQTFSNAYEFHDFARYISQLSLIFVFAYLIILINVLSNYLELFNKQLIGFFFGSVFLIFTFIFFEKIRRDLSPLPIALNKAIPKIEKVQNLPILIDHENSGYLKEILRYKVGGLNFINNEISHSDYIKIIYENYEMTLKIIKKIN